MFFLSTLSKSLVLHYIIVIVRVIFPTVIIINELWVTRTRGNGGWAQCIADINRDACTCQTFMKISAWSYYSDFVHRSPYCSWQRHIWLSLIDLKLQLLKAAATWIFLTDFIIHSLLADGWAKSDLVYVWQDGNPVQLAGNLSLPGGFQLGAFGSEYCDVVTATGEDIFYAFFYSFI